MKVGVLITIELIYGCIYFSAISERLCSLRGSRFKGEMRKVVREREEAVINLQALAASYGGQSMKLAVELGQLGPLDNKDWISCAACLGLGGRPCATCGPIVWADECHYCGVEIFNLANVQRASSCSRPASAVAVVLLCWCIVCCTYIHIPC